MILAIALTGLKIGIDYFIIEVKFEWKWIKKRKTRINHALEEGIFFGAVAAGTMLTKNAYFFAIAYGIKFLLFDYGLNLLRKKEWYYLSQEKKAALVDRLLRKLNKFTVLGLRVSGFIASCFIYYK